MTRMLLAVLLLGAAWTLPASAAGPAKFTVDDLVRIANLTDLDLSPDGEYVVYSVSEANLEDDEARYDVWRARWDGSRKRALTRTKDADEWQPAFSPDGKWIAFLADRGGEDAETQVWLMPADAGEAEQLTSFPGGVLDFDWSPDGKRLALVVSAGPGSADVSVVNADGTDLNRIARCRCDLHGFRPDFYESVAWSFDGTRIAYVSGRGNTVSTIRPDGTGATVVARQAARGVAGGPSARTRGYWYPSFPLWRPTRTR
jgi:Tol biopolymer transport system component